MTGCFDDMLRRSIPQYEAMRETVSALSLLHMQPGTWVVDLGCSRGEALAPLVRERAGVNRFLGIEISAPMVRACRQRFAPEIASGHVQIERLDLRTAYPHVEASVTLAVLTLQFTPIEHRQRIVADIYAHTRPGGALILVEKLLGRSADLDRLMVGEYYALKRRNGYTQAEIDAKRRSLEGVLVPMTAAWNEDLLRTAGFRQVDCFWRWMNFAGWIALRH